MCVLSVLFYISIHAAREGGDTIARGHTAVLWIISIHAAREGGDRAVCACFLVRISIHAAREGGDGVDGGRHRRDQDFNPRRP